MEYVAQITLCKSGTPVLEEELLVASVGEFDDRFEVEKRELSSNGADSFCLSCAEIDYYAEFNA